MVLVASVVLASAYSFWSTLYTDDHGSLGEAGTGPRHASAYGYFWKNFLSFALALFALEIRCFISVVLVSGSHCSGCLGVAYEYESWILREMTFSWVQYLSRQWIHVLRQYSGGSGRASHIFYVAADPDEAVDFVTIHFLLKDALKKCEEEETFEGRCQASAQVKAMTELSRRIPRKRKKRKQHRLPRGVRIRRCGQGSRSVFP